MMGQGLDFVIAGLDPAIHHFSQVMIDARVIGERSDAVLQTAVPAHDGGTGGAKP